jgi:hypothetical protein
MVENYKKWENAMERLRRKPSPKQIAVQTFQRLFKPRAISRKFIVMAPIVVALIVALFSQYIVILPVKGSSAVPALILTGLIIGGTLACKFRTIKIRGVGLGAAIVVGFFLVPYFAFFLGQIHLYAVDRLPPGFKVIEMRPTVEKVVFVTSDNQEVTAWPGPITLSLRPGVTRVYIGTLSIPAGSYIGRRIYLSNVDVDVEIDLLNLEDPETGETIPPGLSQEEYQKAYDNFRAEFDNHFKRMFPNGTSRNWSELDGTKFTFTMSTGEFPEPEFEPENIDYPGFGGPDITLDFTLSEDGTVTVTPIIDMPPGFPQPPNGQPSGSG